MLDTGEAMRIANEAEQSAGSVDDALTQTVQEVVSASGHPQAAARPTGVDGGVIVGLALAVAVLVGAGIAVVRVVRSGAAAAIVDEDVPDGVSAQIATLKRAERASTRRSGHPAIRSPRRPAQEIAVLADNATELFARLDGAASTTSAASRWSSTTTSCASSPRRSTATTCSTS